MSESMKCELCGEPMPEDEQMFKFHGYSGPCPKPPLERSAPPTTLDHIRQFASEEITLSRLAELLGVNVADVQFLRPLCPPVYRRIDADDDARTVADFLVGYWPGLEDGIAWGTDEIDGEHPAYRAAERIRARAVSSGGGTEPK